jgi:hypothetical protein
MEWILFAISIVLGWIWIGLIFRPWCANTVIVEKIQASDTVSTHWAADQENITINCSDALNMADPFELGGARFICPDCKREWDTTAPNSGAEFKQHLETPHTTQIEGVM